MYVLWISQREGKKSAFEMVASGGYGVCFEFFMLKFDSFSFEIHAFHLGFCLFPQNFSGSPSLLVYVKLNFCPGIFKVLTFEFEKCV